MYLRISKQDRTGSKEGSIEHQKKMILNWLHDQQFLQEEENVTQKNYLTDNKNNPTNKYGSFFYVHAPASIIRLQK